MWEEQVETNRIEKEEQVEFNRIEGTSDTTITAQQMSLEDFGIKIE